jgi:hypothetical protein
MPENQFINYCLHDGNLLVDIPRNINKAAWRLFALVNGEVYPTIVNGGGYPTIVNGEVYPTIVNGGVYSHDS